jgi:hypothetical protein
MIAPVLADPAEHDVGSTDLSSWETMLAALQDDPLILRGEREALAGGAMR